MVNLTALRVVLFFSFSYAVVFGAGDGYDYDDYWTSWSKNLNNRINQQVNANLRGLNNLGATISQQVQENMKPLVNLGSRIKQQVYEGLKPVREMEFRFRIMYGNGGTTIAAFKDKSFIVQNGVMRECDGTISETDGSCSGTLHKPSYSKKEDFCYSNQKSLVHNWYCIGTGSINFGLINGQVVCKSPDNSPTLLLTGDEYKRLCENRAGTVTYTYFTNEPLGEIAPDIQCRGQGPYVCTFTSTTSFNNNFNQQNSFYISS